MIDGQNKLSHNLQSHGDNIKMKSSVEGSKDSEHGALSIAVKKGGLPWTVVGTVTAVIVVGAIVWVVIAGRTDNPDDASLESTVELRPPPLPGWVPNHTIPDVGQECYEVRDQQTESSYIDMAGNNLTIIDAPEGCVVTNHIKTRIVDPEDCGIVQKTKCIRDWRVDVCRQSYGTIVCSDRPLCSNLVDADDFEKLEAAFFTPVSFTCNSSSTLPIIYRPYEGDDIGPIRVDIYPALLLADPDGTLTYLATDYIREHGIPSGAIYLAEVLVQFESIPYCDDNAPDPCKVNNSTTNIDSTTVKQMHQADMHCGLVAFADDRGMNLSSQETLDVYCGRGRW